MTEQDQPVDVKTDTKIVNTEDKNISDTNEKLPEKRQEKKSKYYSTDSLEPKMRVIFHRINWSYVLATAILLFLPIYNFAFTSRYGYDFEFRFFLDPELLANLDMERNLMELALPIPIYIFLGILPGVVGLFIGLYVILSATPHVVYLDEKSIRLFEMKVALPIKTDFHVKGLQKMEIGKKRTISGMAWLLLFCLFYLAGMIWYYGFDSVISSGTWYYFNITQPVWDGTIEAFRINLGVQLFVTVLLLLIAGCLIVSFPRREFNMETDEASVNFAYSFVTVKEIEHYGKPHENQLMSSLKILKGKYQESDDRNDREQELLEKPSIFEETGQTSKFVPRFKLLIISIGIVALIAIQIIPGFFFGDFLVPFGVVGLVILLRLLLRTINLEWYSSQKIVRYNDDITIERRNPLAGKRLIAFKKPQTTELMKEPYYPSTFDFFMGGFLIWEICIVVFNMFEFISYFITNAWTILQLTLCALFVFIVVYYYFKPIQRLKVKPENQSKLVDKGLKEPELFEIPWQVQKESMKAEFKEWQKEVSENFDRDEWKTTYKKTLLYFIIPVILFIIWVILYALSTLKFFVYLFI